MSSQISPRNPFRPGMGLEPPYLADRSKHLERFARFLDGFPDLPRNVRLTGLRGVGKTVLLQHYSNAAGERDWLVVRREWSEHLQDERMLALALVEDCRQAAETIARSKRMRHAVSVAQETLDLLGSLTVSMAGIGITVALRSPSERLRQQVTLEDQLFGALKMTVESALTAGRRGLVLCYDEAHVVRDSPRMRQFPLGTLLAVVAKAQREPLPLMLVLSGLPTLTENLALAKSYSERMFQAEELERLRPPEDMNAFCRPLAVAERSFEPTMGEMVIRDTSGYPFFVQFVPPWKRRVFRVGCNYPPTTCRSRSRKLRAAWLWKRGARVGAALTTTERTGTTRRSESGKQGGKVYERRNQWWNPLKGETGSNLVDMGRATAHVNSELEETTSSSCESCRKEGHGESLRA